MASWHSLVQRPEARHWVTTARDSDPKTSESPAMAVAARSGVQACAAIALRSDKVAEAAALVPRQLEDSMAASMAWVQATHSSVLESRSPSLSQASVRVAHAELRLDPHSPVHAEAYWRKRSAAPVAQWEAAVASALAIAVWQSRSEERRGGKEGRCRG